MATGNAIKTWSVLQEQDEYPSAKYGTFPILERETAKFTLYLKTGK
jgi:hypothetical protein